MADVSQTSGPQKPHWHGNDRTQGKGPELKAKMAQDSFKRTKAQAASPLDTLGNAVSSVGRGVRGALHALFDPGARGDAVRAAVASKDAAALKAALKAKRADGSSAWEEMDHKTRLVIDSADPGIRDGMASMMAQPKMQDLISSVKADPKVAKKVRDHIDRLSDTQADETLKKVADMGKSKEPAKEGKDAADQVDGYYNGSAASVYYSI